MKHVLLSISILLSFLPFTSKSVNAQEVIDSIDDEVTVQEITDTADGIEGTTLDEELLQQEGIKLSFGQILLAIIAPISFIFMAYYIIKKFKL